MMVELLDDLRPPPRPEEAFGWRRTWRILTVHSTAAVETIAGLASMVRGLVSLEDLPDHWWLAAALIAVGWFQVWATAHRKQRLRAVAAVLTMLVIGLAVEFDFLTWKGYAGAIFVQCWIVLRSGRVFRLVNGHARP